jgi:tetratricopeptide (TPR) repeat protein
MDIAEKRFGAASPNIATILDNLGFANIHIGRYDEAELQFTRSLAILEANGLMAGPMGINTLYGLALTSVEKNQLDRAQSLLARAVQTGRAIRARTPEMADTLELYSTVLKRLSRSPEAENLHTEAALIRTELALTTRAGQ